MFFSRLEGIFASRREDITCEDQLSRLLQVVHFFCRALSCIFSSKQAPCQCTQAQLPSRRYRLRRRARPRARRSGNGGSAALEVLPASCLSQTPPTRGSPVAVAPASPCSSDSQPETTSAERRQLPMVPRRRRAPPPVVASGSQPETTSAERDRLPMVPRRRWAPPPVVV